jgi:serine/threonine protein kinase
MIEGSGNVLETLREGAELDRGRRQPLEPTRSFRVAIGLATAVGHVHRHGLIHKDIKPANVLVDDGGNVRPSGFGIASRLPHECQAPAPLGGHCRYARLHAARADRSDERLNRCTQRLP